MSELPNNTPNPQDPKPPSTESGGFNWRVVALFSIALVLLGMAFYGTGMNDKAVNLSYSEFRTKLDQGLVVIGDKKKPFRVVEKDGVGNATITGWVKQQKTLPKGAMADERITTFKVPVNLSLQGEEIRNLLGSDVVVRTDSKDVTIPQDAEILSLAAFRKAYAWDEVKSGEGASPQLQVVPVKGGTNAFIIGQKVEIMNLTEPKDKEGKIIPAEPFKVLVSSSILGSELKELIETDAGYLKDSDMLSRALFTFLPFLLIILLLFFLFRAQMKSAGRGAMSFGKSKAKMLMMDRNKVTFKDVAGIQEAKEELYEIVDFLKDPKKFQRLGGSIPKGVLMVGSPGTGKTLLARAIAGEADVPFFSISGSDFVEMFVGVGASRVRDMFEQGKKNAPCLIFIDEIDAVGRHRGHGMGGGHDEREQTLNQLLVEMDGFDTQEGVIIIAATNRPDVLDPALLRPGRFDRQVTVSLPDVNGREEILQVHVKKIKLTADTDLGTIARGTPGFSGAELANLVNEAALLAARKGMKAVTIAEMEEARDKVRWGRERRSLAMSDKEKIGTAWHEAGHAYLNMVLPHTHPLHKVTIIPRGPYLGATMYLPDGDQYSTQKKEALASLVIAMGGRIAEQFHSDDVSNGASGDIKQATSLARNMVCEWGMSDTLGMVEYGEGDGPVFVARDAGKSRSYSDETAKAIDAEIKKFIDNAFNEATQILTDKKDVVEKIAIALLEYETLDATHLQDIIDHGEMKNPPNAPKPPPIPEELSKKPSEEQKKEEKSDGDGLIPDGVQALA